VLLHRQQTLRQFILAGVGLGDAPLGLIAVEEGESAEGEIQIPGDEVELVRLRFRYSM